MNSALDIIPWATCRPQRWKNGGGVTTELASAPSGSGLSDFHWRISVAEVASEGPFSIFPGVDRTLVLIEGEALTLTTAGRSAALSVTAPMLSFRGDDDTTSHLPAGAIRDLNVMTRRGAATHRVHCLADGVFSSDSPLWALFAHRGGLTVTINGQAEKLDHRDLALWSGGPISGRVDGDCLLIEIGMLDKRS